MTGHRIVLVHLALCQGKACADGDGAGDEDWGEFVHHSAPDQLLAAG